MNRDELIERYLNAAGPGAYLRCVRIAARGAWHAAIVVRGLVEVEARATSMGAAFEALAEQLGNRRAA